MSVVTEEEKPTSAPRRTKTPVRVNAPVVINGRTEEGVRPLLELVASLQENNIADVARQEAKRLGPYFNSFSTYLTRSLDVVYPAQESNWEKRARCKKIVTPKNLAGIYNAMARHTRNAMISDVVILSDNFYSGPAAHLPIYSIEEYHYGDLKFNFGFTRVERTNAHNRTSNITLPVFVIGSGLIQKVEKHDPTQLLRSLQSVMTLVNHDMLHHFTLPVINSDITPRTDSEKTQKIFWAWDKDMGKNVYPGVTPDENLYERWAQVSHERILHAQGAEAPAAEVIPYLDTFFNELKRIKNALLIGGMPAEGAHRVVDNFAMMMAHALTRVFPLNSSILDRWADLFFETDPLPQLSVGECVDMLMRKTSSPFPPHAQEEISAIRILASQLTDMQAILASYKSKGFDLLPEKDEEYSIFGMKCLQLIALSSEDVHPHTPAPSDFYMRKLHGYTDKATLDMVIAAADSVAYKAVKPFKAISETSKPKSKNGAERKPE